ncbi:Battenin [Aphelenchoides bicaudatus]|nr:Battenin [Aphelenchoides bicaudatus]
MHRMSFGVQHVFAVVLQVISYLIVAFSDSITTSLIGVVFASLGSGIGEVCYLALASHYSKHIISSWSSGTGGAGIFGALAYAALTEPHLLDLTPQTTLLTMLVVPAVCFVTYFALLTPAATIYPVMKLTQPRTWFVFKVEQKHEQLVSTISQKGSFASTDSSSNESTQDGNYRELRETITSADVAIVVEDRKPKSFKDRCLLMLPTMKYMIPLSLTYFAQYLISQGLSEFTIFDCDHGFGLDIRSQYRWYQVISQFGIFLTRSSVSFFQLPAFLLILLPVFEFINASAFVYDAFSHYIPHLWVSFAMMFLQGLIAGASYVNTLFRIHKSVHPDVREFSLGITAAWNAAGIAGAGVASIPLHSFFCGRYAS